MKPSKRIQEIYNYAFNNNDKISISEAIIKYLDEEHEKNKTVEQRQDEYLSTQVNRE